MDGLKLRDAIIKLKSLPDDKTNVDYDYLKKLQMEIELMRNYIKQADAAINLVGDDGKVQNGSNHGDDLHEVEQGSSLISQTESIKSDSDSIKALLKAYSTILYVPDKDNTIDASVASHLLNNNLRRQELMIEKMEEHNELVASDDKLAQMALADYKEIITHIQTLIHERSQSNSTGAHKLDLDDAERTLKKNLRKVIQKYLEVNNLDSLRNAVQENIKILVSLLRSSSTNQPWISVVPNEYNEQFIKSLIMKNVIIAREDHSPWEFYLRVRDLS